MLRTVVTQNGAIRGLPGNDNRITVFKGIPFAAPPVGDLRWKAPMPPKNWDGVRTAYEFGPISTQDTPGLGTDIYCREWHVDAEIPMSEDCLYLNIWTGAKSAQDKLPVLVWIYGGAFQWGYTAEMEFNGERLARHDVIVVTIGYRLGVLGFLAHPELSLEDPKNPTNFGLLDQQAGLKWVYDNIAAFGGDPENITLGGQSAGGGSVLSLISNPANKKYIKNATIFSGMIRNPYEQDPVIQPKPIEQVLSNGKDFIEYLGVSSIAEARKMDAIKIRDAYAEYAKDHPRFTPCIDGCSITEDPFYMIINGECLDIPLFAGYTGDEFAVPVLGELCKLDKDTAVTELGDKKLFNMVENSINTVGHAHGKLKKAGRVASDMYLYKFDPFIPGEDDPGAFHSCDLWFFFENVPMCHRPYTGAHYELSRRMSDYWTNFIKKGDPNGIGYDGNKLPKWSPVSTTNNVILFE